jgi:predicted acyl esterase
MKKTPKILSTIKLAGFILGRIFHRIYRKPLPAIQGLKELKDIPVPMRDGVHLMANIYLPDRAGRYPVILCMTPYGKDEQPERYSIFKAFGIDVGRIQTSDYTVFEGPDPVFWVERGYIVVHANARGMWNSAGKAHVFDKQNGLDFYDLIEWAAGQPWSTGKIGLNGVSYLAWSQWMAASLQPPHLSAICPWEGFTDMYRDVAYHGGIREIGLIGELTRHRFNAHYNHKYGLNENLLKNAAQHPLDDGYWQNKLPDLSKITVPALICASWSDQGLHTRGSLEGYKRIRSDCKWLYTHGRKKWETYYSKEALDLQAKFFAFFLKGEQNDMMELPPVRLEIRTSYYASKVRFADQWPLRSVNHEKLYLHASTGELWEMPPGAESFIRYEACSKRSINKAVFNYKIEEETELTGGMKLRLWVSSEQAEDMDLYVVIKKFDPEGNEIYFSGYNGNPCDVVAKGWLRVSHRESDPVRSSIEMPYHLHTHLFNLTPNEIVPVEIEILPSSTLFEKHSVLQLVIMGQEPIEYYTFKHENSINTGFHRIFTGGKYDSYLVIPKAKT